MWIKLLKQHIVIAHAVELFSQPICQIRNLPQIYLPLPGWMSRMDLGTCVWRGEGERNWDWWRRMGDTLFLLATWGKSSRMLIQAWEQPLCTKQGSNGSGSMALYPYADGPAVLADHWDSHKSGGIYCVWRMDPYSPHGWKHEWKGCNLLLSKDS